VTGTDALSVTVTVAKRPREEPGGSCLVLRGLCWSGFSSVVVILATPAMPAETGRHAY
jgi:hypothetical protein